MTPFSLTMKCAVRAALALAAMAILLLAYGCGSSNDGGGGGGGGNTGISNANLNGHYVVSQKGIAVTEDLQSTDFFSEGGIFTADGNGHLTNIIDDFTQSGVFFPGSGNPLSGTYGINTDGTGL